MTAFREYARFYDLLYRDKDYEAETEFLIGRLRRWAPRASNILEVGCGSGRHGLCMSEAGYRVTGIDVSADMVALACRHAAGASAEVRDRLAFKQGDIRSVKLGETYQAATSLFHVVSYLTSDADLHAGFASIRRYLDTGGVFVFDFWHAPAVLAEGPQRREKVVEADGWHIHRRTEPEWEKGHDIVRVNFHVTAIEMATGKVHEFKEEHSMRYFYPDALNAILAEHGLVEVERGEWPTGAPARDDVFGVYMVAKAT